MKRVFWAYLEWSLVASDMELFDRGQLTQKSAQDDQIKDADLRKSIKAAGRKAGLDCECIYVCNSAMLA